MNMFFAFTIVFATIMLWIAVRCKRNNRRLLGELKHLKASLVEAENEKIRLDEINKLQDATENIKVSIEEMHKGAKRISNTGGELSSISEKVGLNIKQIGSEIDLFKV